MEAAFTGGLLSWSKVREMTRVATPATEAGLVDIALATTAAQIARLCRTIRGVTRQQAVRQLADRELSWHTNDTDASITITVRLPADRAMHCLSVIHAATTPEPGVTRAASAADAFVELLTDRGTRTVTETIVHITPLGAEIDNGPVIADDIAECLACDSAVTTVADTPEGPVVLDRRRAPTKTQRRWLSLRHRTCQFPGCHHAGSFDAHHIIEHAKGGRTRTSNLARVCWFHHRIIHLHHLNVSMGPDRHLHISFPDGKPVDRNIPTDRFYIEPPDNPDNVAGTWYGDRLNLNDTLTGLNILATGSETDPQHRHDYSQHPHIHHYRKH